MVGLGVAVASCIVARFARVEHAISARCSLAADTASTGLGVAIGGPVVAFFTIVNMPVATERRAAICGAATVCQLCAIAISPITRFADVTHAIAACGQKAIRTTDIRCRIAVCSGLVAAASAGFIDHSVPAVGCSAIGATRTGEKIAVCWTFVTFLETGYDAVATDWRRDTGG